MLVLVLNAGSSSVKYQLRSMPTGSTSAGSVLLDRKIERSGPDDDLAGVFEQIRSEVSDTAGDQRLTAAGHRVVHGGERFDRPVLITQEIIRDIARLSPLAPLHNPSNVAGIRAVARTWPDLAQVAVFDTAFHRTLPEHAWRYALPRQLYEDLGIRRYGFHGTSVAYVAAEAARMMEIPLEDFNAIVAHLGNGASVTAIAQGASVDTSMGFTPLDGLVMGTRSGDLDPSILLFLQRRGWDADELEDLLNEQSGLTALSGHSDMRAIVAAGSDPQARLALDIASYRLAKYIGSYQVAVGGAHAIVFTAGIGENSSQFRQAVVDRLAPIGVQLSPPANQRIGPDNSRIQSGVISAPDSTITVLVVPTDEERAIAEAAVGVVQKGPD